MNKMLKLFILFFMFSPFGHSSQNKDQEDLKPSKISSYQTDRKILVKILQDHQEDSSAFDSRYKHFGDKIINYIKDQGKDPEFLSSHLQTYLEQQTLNLPHIIWMSIQTAIILTTPEQRIRKFPDAVAEHIDRLLEKVWFRGNKSSWTLSASENLSFFPIIKNYLNKVAFIPVIGTDIYDPQFFLKCVADNIYPIGLAVSKFGAHGGIFKTPIELILHDIFHVIERCDIPKSYRIYLYIPKSQHPRIVFLDKNCLIPAQLSLFEINFKPFFDSLVIKPWLRAHADLVKKVIPLISKRNTQFSPQEKNKLLTFFFYALQEVDYNFIITENMHIFNNDNYQEVKFSPYSPAEPLTPAQEEFFKYKLGPPIPKDVCSKSALDCLIKNFEQRIPNFFPDTLNSLETFYERPGKEFQHACTEPNTIYMDQVFYKIDNHEVSETYGGGNQYEYAKKFIRDVIYLLAQTGLYPKISKPLGIDYSVTKARETLLDLHQWILQELKPEGRLHSYFKH